jgi:hypothetical protein
VIRAGELGPEEFDTNRTIPAPMPFTARAFAAIMGATGGQMQFDPGTYRALADAVLVLHVGVVLFVVAGLLLTLAGGALRWRWVHNFWFRAAHLAAIAYVALQAWFDIVCPLTTLEQWLRGKAGQVAFEGDFIGYWFGKLLFYQAPPWVFIAAYTLFGLAVAWSWFVVRPSPPFGRPKPGLRVDEPA